MTKSTLSAQSRANINYQNNALERISNLIVSKHERDVFDALQIIKAHHDGNRAGAIKAAILAYAERIEKQKTGGE